MWMFVLPPPLCNQIKYYLSHVPSTTGTCAEYNYREMLTYKPLTNNAVQEIELIKHLLNKLKFKNLNQKVTQENDTTINRLFTGVTGTKSMCGGYRLVEVICKLTMHSVV